LWKLTVSVLFRGLRLFSVLKPGLQSVLRCLDSFLGFLVSFLYKYIKMRSLLGPQGATIGLISNLPGAGTVIFDSTATKTKTPEKQRLNKKLEKGLQTFFRESDLGFQNLLRISSHKFIDRQALEDEDWETVSNSSSNASCGSNLAQLTERLTGGPAGRYST
jgi:hypothetical protein